MKIVVDEVYKSLFCVSETMKARIEIIAPSGNEFKGIDILTKGSVEENGNSTSNVF